MSYEEEDEGGGGGDRGKLVAVASFFAVHEAELARLRLLAEGIPAYVWGAQTVGVDPLLAVALRVRVAVPERDVPRARMLLGPAAEAFADAARPVFRVRGDRGGVGFAVGLGVGAALGGLVMQLTGSSWWLLGALVLGGVGHHVGVRRRADFCSGCREALPVADVEECPSCHRAVRGTIDDIADRLDAEDALDDAD